jgi:hypothetical protein
LIWLKRPFPAKTTAEQCASLPRPQALTLLLCPPTLFDGEQILGAKDDAPTTALALDLDEAGPLSRGYSVGKG